MIILKTLPRMSTLVKHAYQFNIYYILNGDLTTSDAMEVRKKITKVLRCQYDLV